MGEFEPSVSSASRPCRKAKFNPNNTALDLPLGYQFVEFEIQPDGSTNLLPDRPWCITIVRDMPPPTSTLPADYRTATINPVTCAIREY